MRRSRSHYCTDCSNPGNDECWLTRSRNIVTMAVMLWSYTSSKNAPPYGPGLVGLEISLQVLLGWSLICPTIPCIRPLAMRFTTGGAIVLVSETRNTGDAPSITRSHTDSQGFHRRHSQFPKPSQQQEQDEIELNPYAPARFVSANRARDDGDGPESIENCVVSEGGIHVSRQYEVFTEGIKSKAGTRNLAFPASSKVAVTSNGNL